MLLDFRDALLEYKIHTCPETGSTTMPRLLQILGPVVLGVALVVALAAGGFPWILAAVLIGAALLVGLRSMLG